MFSGVGYAMFLMSSLVGVYYNMILAWALFYLVSSLNSVLPWSSCDNWWNSVGKLEKLYCILFRVIIDLKNKIQDYIRSKIRTIVQKNHGCRLTDYQQKWCQYISWLWGKKIWTYKCTISLTFYDGSCKILQLMWIDIPW